MDNIHMDDLNDYLLNHLPKPDRWMNELEAYAIEHQVPIMEKVSMEFLTQLVLIQQPQRILEVGTAIAYSTLRMHHTLPSSNLKSIEKNEQMYELAKANVEKYKVDDTIELLLGDGIEQLEKLHNHHYFDFIFIDAAKGQYKAYFETASKMLNKHGMIVCDNVLFKNYVYRNNPDLPKRLVKLVEKIHTFNEWLMGQDEFMTTIIPIGDGLSISVKK